MQVACLEVVVIVVGVDTATVILIGEGVGNTALNRQPLLDSYLQ